MCIRHSHKTPQAEVVYSLVQDLRVHSIDSKWRLSIFERPSNADVIKTGTVSVFIRYGVKF